MNKFLATLLVTCVAFMNFNANAANNEAKTKPLSKISDVQNMADDTVVYVQGYIVQNLGGEMYVFQDDTGKINVEIDDDMIGNSISPDTVVWLAATVDNENGEPVTLEVEEIQLLPASGSSQPMAMNSSSKK
jgi:uncharacterized protein (TIGR00156 family)